MCSGSSADNQAHPNCQKRGLVNKITLPPSIGLELIPKLTERNLSRRVIRNLLREDLHVFRLRLGKFLPHTASLLRMERVHNLGGISTIIPVNPMGSSRMSLAPSYRSHYIKKQYQNVRKSFKVSRVCRTQNEQRAADGGA